MPPAPTYTRFLRCRALAKVNLGLRVLGRDAAGYHRLETVFHSLNLADEIDLRWQPHPRGEGPITINCPGSGLQLGPNSSVHRAIVGLRQLGAPIGALRLEIHKRIPLAGGLGGSSADAAAILRALSHLVPGPRRQQQLSALALSLGADVPFQLRGGCAHALGRGEILSPLAAWEGQPVWLILCPGGCDTAQVFAALSETQRRPRCAHGHTWWQQQWRSGSTAWQTNDLWPAARALNPRLAAVAQWLDGQALPWAMSGSGSSCYSLKQPDGTPPAGCQVLQTTFSEG
ncbi:MAG: hypothetical protein EA402_10835 [Planctomycetota bacterium]|nr:MAG: hypothetical protein EA402_10835 [Planctomycetota bacterium]